MVILPRERILKNNIKLFRLQKKLSQIELAKKAGVDRSNLSHIERGEYLPTIKTLFKIAIALNCDVSELLDSKTTISDADECGDCEYRKI